MRTAIIFTIFILCIPALAHASTLKVPSQYPTIQDAIDAASVGDTVLVAPGTFVENIDFIGKDITVKSEKGPDVTVIDGGNPANPNYGSAVTFRNKEGAGALLEGFTVTNGTGSWYSPTPPYDKRSGGGIFIKDASPIVKSNIITKNEAMEGTGGGIICGENSSSLIENNVISCNRAHTTGGGITIYFSTPSATIRNNRIHGNWTKISGGGVSCNSDSLIEKNSICGNHAEGDYPPITERGGGGIYCFYASPVIMDNYIANNTTPRKGGGIFCRYSASPIIQNNFIGGNKAKIGGGVDCYENSFPEISNTTLCMNSGLDKGGAISVRSNSVVDVIDSILWDNSAPTGNEIYIGDPAAPSTVAISYSDLKGGQASVVNDGSTLNWGPGMMDADPLFAAGASAFFCLSQVLAGQPADSPCVDMGSTLASNLGMDVFWTRTDEIPDSGTVDMGFHHGPFTYPALQTDLFSISQGVIWEANFILLAGTSNAYRSYILLTSVTGTEPGTSLPGGKVTLPLNWDLFTNLAIGLINTPFFFNFLGTLDDKGSAGAKLDPLAPIAGVPGLTMHFAYALNNPWDFVSNPVGIVFQ